jgi:hypothetical protein
LGSSAPAIAAVKTMAQATTHTEYRLMNHLVPRLAPPVFGAKTRAATTM